MLAIEKNNIYAVIAELMSLQVFDMLQTKVAHVERFGERVVVPIPYFDHFFSSNLEKYAVVLVSLGVLKPITSHPGECCFQLTIEPRDVYRHVASLPRRSPSFDELLATFLYHSVDFGGVFELIALTVSRYARSSITFSPCLCNQDMRKKKGLNINGQIKPRKQWSSLNFGRWTTPLTNTCA